MKRYISAVLVCSIIFYSWGCTSSYRISKNTFIKEENKDVTLNCTIRDTDIELNLEDDQYQVLGDTITITRQPGHNIKMPLSDIKEITVHEFDYAGNFFIIGVIGFIVLAISLWEFNNLGK